MTNYGAPGGFLEKSKSFIGELFDGTVGFMAPFIFHSHFCKLCFHLYFLMFKSIMWKWDNYMLEGASKMHLPNELTLDSKERSACNYMTEITKVLNIKICVCK